MGNLASTKCYLSGAIESASGAPYQAKGWRQEITPKLRELGIVVYDPLVKPDWMPVFDGSKQRDWAKSLEDNTNYDIQEIEHNNSTIRKWCLNLVRHSNIIIVKIDKTFTVGTFEEIKLAEGKPIFIIADGIPSMWLIDQLDLYNVHRRGLYLCSDLNACVGRLGYINSDVGHLDRLEWLFLTSWEQKTPELGDEEAGPLLYRENDRGDIVCSKQQLK